MRPHDINFIQAAKQVGLDQAKSLISLLETWEGVQASKPNISKTKTAQAEKLGQAVLALVPEPKRGGRKPDPNSNFQRVKATIERLLASNGSLHIDHLFPQVCKETGLSLAVCKANAMQVKGIQRNYGQWSLKAA